MRDEIFYTDLASVMDAAELLRRHGLISVEQIREIRAAVADDTQSVMERCAAFSVPPAAVLAHVLPVWERVKPL